MDMQHLQLSYIHFTATTVLSTHDTGNRINRLTTALYQRQKQRHAVISIRVSPKMSTTQVPNCAMLTEISCFI